MQYLRKSFTVGSTTKESLELYRKNWDSIFKPVPMEKTRREGKETK